MPATDTLNNCVADHSIEIKVIKKRNVYIPNVFTPNGDGINDVFTVFGGPDVAAIKVIDVFNRWGQLVYHSDNSLPNSRNGWNGMIDTEALPSGVFVYYIEVEFIDSIIIPYKGSISIVL